MQNEIVSSSLSTIHPGLDVFSVIIILGVIQGIILSLFFLSRKEGVVVSNRLIGLITIAFSAVSFEIFLRITGYIEKVSYVAGFSGLFDFAFGPWFYLYVYTKVWGKEKLRFRQYLHMIPFVFYAIYFMLLIKAFRLDPLYLNNYVSELFLSHFFIYSVVAVYTIFQVYKSKNVSFFSHANQTLSRLRNYSLLVPLMIIIIFIAKISFVNYVGSYIIAFWQVVFVYSLSFHIINRSAFFSEKVFSHFRKYEKSSLTEELQQKILKKLQIVMEEEKSYLDYSISLPSLAKSIGVSPNHLSQVLNDCLKKNFFSYIATYRVEEAKRILSNPENANLMIEEVAERVGYNSKSAFNSAFRKETGMTPSQFQKKKIEF